jgi:hypothetical protein
VLLLVLQLLWPLSTQIVMLMLIPVASMDIIKEGRRVGSIFRHSLYSYSRCLPDHSAASHQQYPSSYSQYDQKPTQQQGYQQYDQTAQHQQQQQGYQQYDAQPQQGHQQDSYYDAYSTNHNPLSPPLPSPNYGANSNTSSDYSASAATPAAQPERQYTLGGGDVYGDGYGANSVPPLQEHSDQVGGQYHFGQMTDSPKSLQTNLPSKSSSPQPARSSAYEDSPPGYDAGTSGVQGRWGKQ